MTFANPAGNAVAAAEGYVRALLELLGDRDPLAVAAELVPWLERRTAGVPDDVLRRPEERAAEREVDRRGLERRALARRAVGRRAVARERLVAARRRPPRRRPVLRSDAGISSVATAFVSCSICRARKSRMRSSSRRMRLASCAVSRSPTFSASVPTAV